jgi:hypothetical protein
MKIMPLLASPLQPVLGDLYIPKTLSVLIC